MTTELKIFVEFDFLRRTGADLPHFSLFHYTVSSQKIEDWDRFSRIQRDKSPCTLAVWTPKKFFTLLTRPQGSQGGQKMRQNPLNMPGEVWCAKIVPKLENIQKSLLKSGFLTFGSQFGLFFRLVSFGGYLRAKGKQFNL